MKATDLSNSIRGLSASEEMVDRKCSQCGKVVKMDKDYDVCPICSEKENGDTQAQAKKKEPKESLTIKLDKKIGDLFKELDALKKKEKGGDKEVDKEIRDLLAKLQAWNKKRMQGLKIKGLKEGLKEADPKIIKKIAKLTDANDNNAARIELAKLIKDKDALKKMEGIKMIHRASGSISFRYSC